MFSRLVLALIAVALLAAPPAAAHDSDVFSPRAHPYGQSYSEWAADWWVWALSQPNSTNPLLDTTGERCANQQRGRVWFLAGTNIGGQSIVRRCTVPRHTALLFPIVNNGATRFVCDDPPNGCVSDDPNDLCWDQVPCLRQVLRTVVKPLVHDLFASIDGDPVRNLEAYFEESAVIRVALPDDDLFNQIEGWVIDPMVDIGYYLMVKPLSPGRHTIRFKGAIDTFTIDMTYRITVERH